MADHDLVSLVACLSTLADHVLVQHAAAAFDQAAIRNRGVELRDLGLQMLVDEQQRFQRAAKVAAAIGYDFVDSCVARSETHQSPLTLSITRPCCAICLFLWILWTRPDGSHP